MGFKYSGFREFEWIQGERVDSGRTGGFRESVAEAIVQRLLDEKEAALVEERVLPLRLADVQVVRVHLDEVPDAEVCRRRRRDKF